jgi:hypothetical protein
MSGENEDERCLLLTSLLFGHSLEFLVELASAIPA